MPISVKDYSWKETEAEVSITLPLKGVKSNKADIFSTDRYIKVNYPPYLFEVHLFQRVIEEQCTAKVGNGVVAFRLIKEEPRLWGRLTSPESGEKGAMVEKRAEAVEHVQRVAAELQEEKVKRKREEERYVISQQMKLEQEERERIENKKQDERDKATKELEEWKEEEKQIRARVREEGTPSVPQGFSKGIWNDKLKDAAPPPRKGGSIQVRFTPRSFLTPSRESTAEMEQEWLSKMALARRIKDPEKKEESINEKNPEFLKDKGVEFFKAGNYEAALNVFTEAIRLNDGLPHLYSNRAACYLATGDNSKCISDCSRALQLLFPVVPSNCAQRTRVLARRGAAYANSGQLDLALNDYDEALKLSPKNDKLREDNEKIRQALLNSSI